MKKILLLITSLFLVVFLASCGETVNINRPTQTIIPTTSAPIPSTNTGENPTDTNTEPSENENETRVQLVYNGLNFNASNYNIKILFTNKYQEYSADVDADGLAKIEDLDGEFNVHIDPATIPSGYSYNLYIS